ncbi:MAG: hypothetical protein COW16_11200 [Sphingomonadales bacterium CG12_big_fil_rev_8_21_14_0_65_65_10]|nr:MAG: hypothetical protein COW16_11200 [Sphingomonadales bacterium CG12_big_fil_rev_8_21_14_0_65_65_10]
MDTRIDTARKGLLRNALVRQRLRQIALFAGILISGGLLSIPRLPLLAIVVLICFALRNLLQILKVEWVGIWMLLAATVAVALIGGESFQLVALATRLANFLAGAALLLLYVDRKPGTLSADLYPLLKLMAYQAVLTPIVYLAIPQFFVSFRVQDAIYETFLYVFTFHEFVANATFFKRPDGFFFEPGVFQIYLNIFLFICLFLRRFSAFDIGLATLAVIATQSTTGAVILILQYGVVYLRWLKESRGAQQFGLFLIGPVLLLPLAAYTTYNVGEKFYGEASGSAEAREFDLRTGLSVVMEKPLTGIGFDYDRYFDVANRVGYREAELSVDNITDRANSNGIVTLLYSVGIPISLIFFWGAYRQRLFRPRWLFAALIFLSLSAEALFLSPFFLMLVFSGLLLNPRRSASFGERRGAPRSRKMQAA